MQVAILAIGSVLFIFRGVLIIRKCGRAHPTLPPDVWIKHRVWYACSGLSYDLGGAVTFKTLTVRTWMFWPLLAGFILAIVFDRVFKLRVAKELAESTTDT